MNFFYLKQLFKAMYISNALVFCINNSGKVASFFPDENFRNVVFEALRDGVDNAEGATIEEAIGGEQ